MAGDAFRAALRIPNFLQNLFGEGVLSASFIPVYANLLARGDEDEARRVAGHILTWLMALVSILVLLGVTATPLLINVIAPGFIGERRDLAIQLVQIFFPGTGLLVIAAWCLGVLNSHRRFFVPYVAPVLCNIAMMTSLLIYGPTLGQSALAVKGAWGFVIGTSLQLLMQLPTTLRLVKRLHLGFGWRMPAVLTVLGNFLPVMFSRGVVQISAYIDTMLSSLLPTGALSALGFAQTLYILPVSLFGMSVSASQLPAMSSHQGSLEQIAGPLRDQLKNGLRRIAFLVIPSVVVFLVLGDVVVGAIYQSGAFRAEETHYVWMVLAGYSVGLLAATLGRLYASTFYALRDTRTPLKFALIRVVLSTIFGYMGGVKLVPLLHLDLSLGTVGLTLAAGLSGWIEYSLLKFSIQKRIGRTALPWAFLAQVWGAAIGAAAIAFAIKVSWHMHPLYQVVTVLVPFGVIYLGTTSGMGLPEAQIFTRKLIRRRRNSK